MLVYFVNHSVAPTNLGGAERSMIKLVEEWYASDPDFEAHFITKAPRGRFIEAIEERDWAYTAFRYRGWTIPKDNPPLSEITYFAREDYAATLDIIALMEERRPDLVVTNTIVAPWAAFAANLLGIPHAWFVREYGDLDHGLAFQIGREDTFRDIGLLSNAVFTNSLALREHIGQYLDVSKVSVVYPSVDAARLTASAEEQPTQAPFAESDSLRITVVGRLSASKGQWRVVEALGELHRRGTDARLCLVGSWEEAGYDMRLRDRARELGVGDRLTIVGEQSNPFPHVAAADVCVTPSGVEAFGRTTLEYMVLGKPVVAGEQGGSAELVHEDVNGFHFDVESATSLADALERYAMDPRLIERHGAAARERSRSFIDSEYGNAAAIERLKATAKAEPYRLPQIARYWFSLPGAYTTMHRRAPSTTLAFVGTRFRSRFMRLVRSPIATIRRRFTR